MSQAPQTRRISFFKSLMDLRLEMAQAAQVVYDEWTQDPAHEFYEPGGICEIIADQILEDVIELHFGTKVTFDYAYFERHTFLVLHRGNEHCSVDIHWGIYEIYLGRGEEEKTFWEKKPGIQFKAENVEIYKVSNSDLKYMNLWPEDTDFCAEKEPAVALATSSQGGPQD